MKSNKRRFKAEFNKRPVSNGVFPGDEVLPGDGIDPRLDQKGAHKVVNRKALQLCAQVMDSLNLSLSASGDDVLRELYVDSVTPAPDSSQLLVVVALPTTSEAVIDWQFIIERLNVASGKLRHDVAASINRKRVPQLRFVIR